MKCLIYCPDVLSNWTGKYFGNVHPYFIRILNKPLLEYYIDFCVLIGIKDIRIIKSDVAMAMEEYFADGTKWGVKISYSLARDEDKLKRIILKNSGFCKNNDLMIIHGFAFLNFNKNMPALIELSQIQDNLKIVGENSSLYFLKSSEKPYKQDLSEIKSFDSDKVALSTLDSIGTYFNLSMDILKNKSDNYFLPGFSNEPDEFVGMNVIFNSHAVRFHKPVMIGNNVQIKNDSVIGPETILGNNVIIDSFSDITHSIIYDQSYIGSDLEIDNKIVCNSHLINPTTGNSMEIADTFFVSNIDHNIFSDFFRKMLHSFFAIVLFILYAFPNAIFGLLELLGGSMPQKGEFYMSKKCDIMELPVWKMKHHKPLTLAFMRFSLDKYPLLVPVIFGKLSLVGNRLKQANTSSMKFISNLNTYRPGVFDYPGMFSESFSEEENEMHELYYAQNATFFMDIKIILNTLFGRFFNVSNYLNNKSYK